MCAPWLTHLEHQFKSLAWQPWLEAFSQGHTLLRYDARGCGLVIDAAGFERFDLIGACQGGPTAIEYAARHLLHPRAARSALILRSRWKGALRARAPQHQGGFGHAAKLRPRRRARLRLALGVEADREPTLTAIAAWLLFNLMLPPVYEHPRLEFVSLSKVESFYDDATRTIYLPKGWTGRSPAELSLLVHEMVHHVQNVAGLTYACAGEREKIAYAAQRSGSRSSAATS